MSLQGIQNLNKMNKYKVAVLVLTIPLLFTLCKRESDIELNLADQFEYDDTPYDLEYAGFADPDLGDNPLTIEGVKLGRMLFYEPSLSKDGSMFCGSCHLQEYAFSDTAQFSIGVEGLPGGRQAMAVFNTAWHTNEFFWDGRAHLLRDQSLKPIQDPLEMNETLENAIDKLSEMGIYQIQFKKAFGDEEITSERMSLALEQFMNSIVSNKSKYDKYLAGEETLTDSEERGRVLFFTEYDQYFPELSGADCAHCHGGTNFDNNDYMNNGLDELSEQTDEGRMKVTGDPMDRAKFKVTSLRNIELTPPYMHDGRFSTLEEVVDHYDHGIHKSPTLDFALDNTTNTGLRLTDQDKKDLIAFLKTLTDQELIANEAYSNPFE